ncbi:enoyl-CoA hydratase/isomerase family protein [Alcaligenaceae bacterium]|nr:enoyl-CoA hydratase/isomerase family protein [Alcaligenaceae bacterium]
MNVSYDQYQYINVENRDGIATVTLNRPELLNAVNPEVHAELEYIFVDIARDESIKVVVLTGAGKAFSAGGDIKRMAERAGTQYGFEYAIRVPEKTRRIYNSLLEVEQPIIAAVNGDAIGLGANIALFCDITIASETARIGDTHVKVGLVAGDGGAIIWPLLLGPQRAKEFLMRGLLVKGAEAARIGLVSHAVPSAKVMEKAYEIAAELAALPKWAVRWTKLSINKNLKQQLNLTLDTSISYEALSMQTADYKEAATAFAEKRKPVFVGR